MQEIPFFVFSIVALSGGVLSFMSPCTAIILPTFFAYTFKEKTRLVWATFVFFFGLVIVYVPLGLGLSIFSARVFSTRSGFGLILGIFFLVFGYLSFAGRGLLDLGLGKLTPKFEGYALKNQIASIFTLGVFTGFGTTPCAGPILGAIATLAAATQNSAQAIILMGLYTFGLFLPLLLIALFIERVQLIKRVLRGKVFKINIAKRQFSVHSTNFIAGSLFTLLGLFFLLYGNSFALTTLFAKIGVLDIIFDLQDKLLNEAFIRS